MSSKIKKSVVPSTDWQDRGDSIVVPISDWLSIQTCPPNATPMKNEWGGRGGGNSEMSYQSTQTYEGDTFDEFDDDYDDMDKPPIWLRILKHFGAFCIASFLFVIFLVFFVFSSNSAISNFISSKDVVVVPNIIGADINNARRVLSNIDLKIDVMDTEYSELPEGYIITQIPSSGREIYANRSIQVIISRGQKIVTMPALRGTPYHNINDVLRTHELRLGNVTRRYSNEIASGFIITTAPTSGESIMAGTAIDIVLSIGRDPLEPMPIPVDLTPTYDFFDDFFEESIF